tara:strand:- start:2645 stop:4450 length:1806 start_codon:yes stop_codon:yes gene_type:complete
MKKEEIKDYGELSNLEIIFKLFKILNKKQKLLIFFLIIIMIFSGISEAISLAAIIPFLKVLSNPDSILEVSFVKIFSNNFGIYNSEELILPTSILFMFLIIITAAVRIMNLYLNGLMTAKIGSYLSCRIFSNVVNGDYIDFIYKDTNSIINTITRQINLTIIAISCSLQLLTSLIIIICLTFILFFINFKIAAFIGLFLFSAYSIIGFFNNKNLTKNSRKITILGEKIIKIIREGFGSMRNIILENNQEFYINEHIIAEYPIKRYEANNRFLRAFPRYIFELLGIILIVLTALNLKYQGKSEDLFPLLGSLALGAQRLLPSCQQVFSSWAGIRANSSAVEEVIKMVDIPFKKNNFSNKESIEPYKFNSSIIFKNINFKYPTSDKLILKNINFTIQKGEIVGIIGETGSGKSTLLDLLLGLFNPDSGEIIIDNKYLFPVKDKLFKYQWQKNISSVPQNIYLTDNSFARNIAFGIPLQKIDFNKIEIAAKKAEISKFINSLPNKYNTFTGERGIKISGGEKQRIAIARALYKESSILIFDEATSALDNKTELSIINTINNLKEKYTIIMVAHRLTTLKNCDKIIKLKDGKIFNIGTPKSILDL